MELIFKKAELCNLNTIFSFVQNAVAVMTAQKIFQWDEVYPAREDFERDIQNGEAFIAHVIPIRRNVVLNCENDILNRNCHSELVSESPRNEMLFQDQHDRLLIRGDDCKNHGKIAAVYVLNKECDEAYKTGKWQYNGKDFVVMHRFCVNPEFQNQGIGFKVCSHILEQAKKDGIKSVRLDVFTENPYSQKLYEKLGFKTVGNANWRKGKFLLQEKIL